MRKEIYENQESSDTLPFHWEFGKEEITLKVSSYAYGNGLAVLMYSQSEIPDAIEVADENRDKTMMNRLKNGWNSLNNKLKSIF